MARISPTLCALRVAMTSVTFAGESFNRTMLQPESSGCHAQSKVAPGALNPTNTPGAVCPQSVLLSLTTANKFKIAIGSGPYLYFHGSLDVRDSPPRRFQRTLSRQNKPRSVE